MGCEKACTMVFGKVCSMVFGKVSSKVFETEFAMVWSMEYGTAFVTVPWTVCVKVFATASWKA